jgi:LytS/YehU family sensor histidine kinase
MGLRIININDKITWELNRRGLKISNAYKYKLVENAIKHNVFTKNKPLNIYLGVIDNTDLKVVNNKTKPPEVVKSTHIGLKNIEKRYRFFTKSKIKIIDSQDFEVNVPLIKDQQVKSAA